MQGLRIIEPVGRDLTPRAGARTNAPKRGLSLALLAIITTSGTTFGTVVGACGGDARPNPAAARPVTTVSNQDHETPRPETQLAGAAPTPKNAPSAPDAEATLQPGTPMPDMEIELVDKLAERVAGGDGADELVGDRIWRPSDARGKVVLIDIWATYCRPCRASFPVIEAEWQKRRERGLVVIAVSEDEDLARIAAFVAETGVTFPIGIDPEQEMVRPPVSVRMMPAEILIDRRGVVRRRHEGLHPGDLEHLFEAIDGLLAESP